MHFALCVTAMNYIVVCYSVSQTSVCGIGNCVVMVYCNGYVMMQYKLISIKSVLTIQPPPDVVKSHKTFKAWPLTYIMYMPDSRAPFRW